MSGPFWLVIVVLIGNGSVTTVPRIPFTSERECIEAQPGMNLVSSAEGAGVYSTCTADRPPFGESGWTEWASRVVPPEWRKAHD